MCLHRTGEYRDRGIENRHSRGSGLNLTIAAITLWNTVYLSRAVAELRVQGEVLPDTLLAHIGPLGWEHISFNCRQRLAVPTSQGHVSYTATSRVLVPRFSVTYCF